MQWSWRSFSHTPQDLTMRLHVLIIPALVLCGMNISSCAPATGTKIHLGQQQLSQIKSLGVLVRKEEGFSVRISREMPIESAHLGSWMLLAVPFEVAIRSGIDTATEEKLKPVVGAYDPRKELMTHLLQRLDSTKVFAKVSGITPDENTIREGRVFDGVLEVTLKQWGLRLCVDSDSEDKVQVAVAAYARIAVSEEDGTLWGRNEFYIDGRCHTLNEFQSREGLIKITLSRTMENLARKLINEVLFP